MGILDGVIDNLAEEAAQRFFGRERTFEPP
jgi:hypothetical protein